MSNAKHNAQRGVALMAALFLLTVLAVLGLIAVKVSVVQSHTVSLSLQSARAFQAAQTGIEYAAYQALVGGSCGSASLTLSEGGLAGFDVTITCSSTVHGEGSEVTTVYALQAFASFGAYGSPDYVSRRIRAAVTDST